MDLPVFYANANEAIEITPVAFFNLSGAVADPASVSCIVADPAGATTTYTYLAPTTVAAGSDSGEISTIASWSSPSAGVLDVASSTGFPTSGTITVATSDTPATVTYTGVAAGQLTGCTYVSGSATGTVSTGGAVTLVLASSINQIVKTATGDYSLSIDGLSVSGLYMFTWIGTGNMVQQVTPGTFRLVPLTSVTTGMQNWYCGLDEFKSRNSIPLTSTADDYEIQMAIQVASGWINRYCGTHFYQVAEARTYPVTDIYYLPIDQIVPGSITSFKIDYDGDGVFETAWTEGQNYQVYREGDTYNQNYAGLQRPYDYVKVIMGGPALVAGGGFFPFVWPFTHDDRVQITGTWGWQQVPPEVTQACLIMATQLFKEKDSPWGMAGVGDLGVIRTSQSPFLVELLRPFKFPRKVVGI